MDEASWPRLVRRPDGEEYSIEVGPAKRMSLFWHTPARLVASLTNDRSTWITVTWRGLPILRERHADLGLAEDRARALAARIQCGDPPQGLAFVRSLRRRL